MVLKPFSETVLETLVLLYKERNLRIEEDTDGDITVCQYLVAIGYAEHCPAGDTIGITTSGEKLYQKLLNEIKDELNL